MSNNMNASLYNMSWSEARDLKTKGSDSTTASRNGEVTQQMYNLNWEHFRITRRVMEGLF